MKEYDYLIVGSGLFGSVFAHEAKKQQKKCLVIDKRNHIGGNLYCEKIENINVHKYGPHIFHTSDERIWKYVNKFASFNRFTYSPIAIFDEKMYNLPLNMNTFNQLWGSITPGEAIQKIGEQIDLSGIKTPKNLEEKAISLVGHEIYSKLIKGYTEKQWGRSAVDLPAFIIKRLLVRFTYDNNYFNDKFQGIPIGGYNTIINNLLEGTEVRAGIDYLKDKVYWNSIADKIVYTGAIDEFYDYKFGHLEYRSLKFENEILPIENFQGNAAVNYTNKDIPYTRIIEHKHFEDAWQKNTVITKEYPIEWRPGMEKYYPINDSKNNLLYTKYKEVAAGDTNLIFGGRLAEYKYYDMHQVIASALKCFNKVSVEI